MHRYFVFIWDAEDSNKSARVASIRCQINSNPAWDLAYDCGGLLVIHQPLRQRSSSVHYLANYQGAVVGSLFHNALEGDAPEPVADFNDFETHRIVRSAGRHLVEKYWGSYIAVVRDLESNACNLLRDPTANLACYHAKWCGIHIFFSDMDDFVRYIPMALSVNWRHMTARLLGDLTLSRECSLNEIEDIPGGEWVTLSNEAESRTVLWHPARFCIEDGLHDESKAALTLRTTILGVVHALASDHQDIMVLLSGGLDSSIVTSCLAQLPCGPNVTCLNFYITGNSATPSPGQTVPGLTQENLAKVRRTIGSADEREFAHKVVNSCGFSLLERERSVCDLNVGQIYNAPLAPRPSASAFIHDLDQVECECATFTHATVCFTGQGGDTVFYATQQVLGALDYAFLHPFGPHLVREVIAAARLSRESFAHVLMKVLRHGFMRAPLPSVFDPFARPNLLRDDAAKSGAACSYRHPWIDAASHLCPGKYNHVVGVTDSALLYHRVSQRERIVSSSHPLLAQPVVEASLRIPTYVLLAGGISRGLARRTFQDLLPSEVYRRTVKGTGTALYQNIVRRNIGPIRECLLGGALVRQNLLDYSKLETYLTVDQPFLTVQAEQILDYLTCEAWLTQLTSKR